MAKAGNLIVSLMLDSTRYAAGLSETTKKTNRTVKQIQREIKGLVNFAVGAGGFYAVVRGIQAVTNAAAAQEEATLRLSQALKNNFQFTGQNLRALEDQASALQKVTRYGDDAITGAQALLMAVGKLDAEGVRKLTPSLLDFATAMGMDLNGAASLLAKTVGSTTNALSRYGVQIDMTKDSTGKMAELVEKLQAQFGDQSKIKGAATAMAQLKNAYGDIAEELGLLLNGPEVGVAQGWTLVFNAIADGMKRVREERELLRNYGSAPGIMAQGAADILGNVDYQAGTNTAKSKALHDARMKRITEDIWLEQQNFLKQANAGAATSAPQNWGKAPFTRFGTFGMMGFAGRDRTTPRLGGFRDADIPDYGAEFRALREKYRIEEDLADWYRQQDDISKRALIRKRDLEIARENFEDYAWSIKSTWAYAIQSMIDGNKAFALTFENLVARPMLGVATNRAANWAVDQLFGQFSGLPIWNYGGRSMDAGSGSSSVGKAAVGGGVTVNITGPTADQIIAIVDGNMRNNGVLRR
jgi:hypothetical protein